MTTLIKRLFKTAVIGFGGFVALLIALAIFLPKSPNAPATVKATTTATTVATTPKTVEAKLPQSEWQSEQDRDGMGRERWFTWVKSTNTVDFAFPYTGDQHGRLSLLATKDEIKDVRFSIERGQFACSISDCYIQVRFDDGPIRRYRVTDPSDHSSTLKFINDHGGFVAALRKAKKVRIEATFYQEGNQTFEFNTAGFGW